MKYDGFYYAELLIPTEYSRSMEMGFIEPFICQKIGENKYMDINSKRIYGINAGIGCTRIVYIAPLTEFFNRLGFKKKNDNYKKENVYSLVKKNKSLF